MIQIDKVQNRIIDLMDVYIMLTHQYRLNRSAKVWDELSDVEEEIDRLRVLLFKSDKVASKYANNKTTFKANELQQLSEKYQNGKTLHHAERIRIS